MGYRPNVCVCVFRDRLESLEGRKERQRLSGSYDDRDGSGGLNIE